MLQANARYVFTMCRALCGTLYFIRSFFMRLLSVEEEQYEGTYANWFVSLPGILTMIVGIVGAIASIVMAIVFSIWWVFLIGAAITAVVALLTYFLTRLTLSPIVVAINRLTEIRNIANSNSPNKNSNKIK